MGSQEPSARIAPRYKTSDGPDAEALLAVVGLILDPWQSGVLCDWMGRDAAGRWAASSCGGSVPRQNGKTLVLQGRAIAGMVLLNENVVYTSHLQKTSTETFSEMRDIFEHPKLKPYVKDIRNALGREEIILKSGARIKFLARTRNGGRGQHGDLLIFDEAQELDETAQESFLPAISASRNPQTIYIGTPPGPDVTGTVKDPKRWAKTNPALGRRMLLSTIEGEAEQMAPDSFARERLGWWSPKPTEHAEYILIEDAWDRCVSDEQKPDGKTAYGVTFAADGSAVCLCGAVLPKDGPARISLIELQPGGRGIAWLADWLNARYGKASCVVIDGRGGADVLVDRIRDVWRVKTAVVRPSARDVVAAAGLLINTINEGGLTWYRQQQALRESAVTATKRPIGGGFGFGGDNSLPIEACALALWGAKTSRRDPTRKMRIG